MKLSDLSGPASSFMARNSQRSLQSRSVGKACPGDNVPAPRPARALGSPWSDHRSYSKGCKGPNILRQKSHRPCRQTRSQSTERGRS